MAKFTEEKIKQILNDGTESEVKELTSGDPETIKMLVSLVEKDEWPISQRAANALAMIQTKKDISEFLAPLFKRTEKTNKFEDRKFAINILALNFAESVKLGKFADNFLKILSDKTENEDLRWGCAQALGNMCEERAIKPLMSFMRETGLQQISRNSIAYSLSKILAKKQNIEKEVDELLTIAIHFALPNGDETENKNVRSNALDVFGRLRDILDKNANSSFTTLKDPVLDKETDVQAAARYKLELLRHKKIIP
jgi:HEAT repeat protein